MKKYNILYIITLPDIGGAQVHLREVISRLPEHINYHLIVGRKGWLTDNLIYMEERIHIVESLVRHISIKSDLKAIFEIRTIINRIKPDLVHCHSSKAGFIGRVSALICRVPSIFTVHGWAFTNGVSIGKRYMYKIIEKVMVRWTDKIICVSEYDRKLALADMYKFKEKLTTIHNGIPDVRIRRHRICSKEEKINIIMVARFSEQKDHRLLIEAIKELNADKLRFHLSLIGEGPLFERERAYINDLGLFDSISLYGMRTDVNEILASQDIFLLISNWEGFPISILEAMRQELPVIASDVGGISEAVIDGVCGYLIPRSNKKILKDRLLKLFCDDELRIKMGETARKRYLQLFSSDEMMRKLLELYYKLLEK